MNKTTMKKDVLNTVETIVLPKNGEKRLGTTQVKDIKIFRATKKTFNLIIEPTRQVQFAVGEIMEPEMRLTIIIFGVIFVSKKEMATHVAVQRASMRMSETE